MKIQVDNIVRDMTPEEEAALIEAQREVTDEEALEIILGGVEL